MKHSTLLIAIIIAIMTSCTNIAIANKTIDASGPDINGTITTEKIIAIQAQQAIIVQYTVGPTTSVKYTVPESLASYLEITCSNGKLKCAFKDNISVRLNKRQVLVEVVAPDVQDFDASSAAQIYVSGQLNVPKLDIEGSSAALISIATVQAAKADIESSSAAKVTIEQLSSKNVDIESSSSAKVAIGGTIGLVEAEASSAASIILTGSYKHLNAEASSGASINATKASISTGKLQATSGASVSVSQAVDAQYKTSKSSGGSINIK